MRQIIFFLLSTSSLWAQVARVEPPFWWSGMQHSSVEIMFYGKNIAENDVAVSNGIIIEKITKTENPNYLFVTIDTRNSKSQNLVFTFKTKNKSFTQNYSLKERMPDSRLRKSFDASDVMYLIMPDRFANGNPNNDNHHSVTEKHDRNLPGGRHGGDIEGIIQNLDYIKELGATAIWSTPLCEDNDKTYSYHTYGQSDVYRIDPRYGTNDDYARLSLEMKKRGLKLIKDYVTNHWGAEHWMFKDMPTYTWFHQFPGYAQTNYRMTTQFDTNASKTDTQLCMDGWFVKSMPDLNQSNPLVNNYLIQNAIWWIEFADLDGFRVDTYSYCDKKGIAEWTKAITDEYPYFNIVGEVWMHDQAQMAYWQKDSKIAAIQSYNSHLPSVMDFTLHDALSAAFSETESAWDKGMIKIYENFTNDFLYPNIDNILVFAENHDTQRLNQMYSDIRDYQLVMTLINTVRGIPQIYYGSEIGMKGDKNKGDADIRQDFPGGWKDDSNNAFTKNGRTEIQNQYFDFSKKLLNWRKNKSVVHHGKMTHYVPEQNVYVYFRYDDQESVMVLINNTKEKQIIDTNRFKENTQNYTSGKDVLSGKTYALSENLTLEGKTALILELN
jgi:glycosidase